MPLKLQYSHIRQSSLLLNLYIFLVVIYVVECYVCVVPVCLSVERYSVTQTRIFY